MKPSVAGDRVSGATFVPRSPAAVRALELLADRWTMWILTELDDEGTRFSDLADVPGLSRRVLAERLVRLQDAGLVDGVVYSRRPLRRRYRLTPRGSAIRDACIVMLDVASGIAHRDVDAETAMHPSVRLLEADPIAARQIVDETIAPIVRYDEQYRTQLLDTLRVYLEANASTSVAAAKLFAHRHTIRYRLARVRELTGLDVDVIADRERLILGLRSLRMFSGQATPNSL